MALAQTGGQVRVRFSILEGNPSASAAGATLQSKYSSNALNVGYTIVNLTVSGIQSTTAASSATTGVQVDSSATIRSPFASLSLLLVSFLLFRKTTAVAMLLLFSTLVMQANAFSVYENCKLMSDTINYRLYWNVSAPYIYIGIEARATGWVAFGLSLNGQMSSGGTAPGTDIYLGFKSSSVTACANGCINDYSTVVWDIPVLDGTQNAELLSFNEANGVTQMEFRRLLNTGDSTNDQVITTATQMWVLWAVHTTDKPLSTSQFGRHDYKGPLQLNFGQSSQCPQTNAVSGDITMDVDPSSFDLTTFKSNLAAQMGVDVSRVLINDVIQVQPPICPTCTILELKYSDYLVPSARTTYSCVGFTLPADKKYHVIRFEPIIDKTSVVHHILVYQASSAFSNSAQPCDTMPAGANPMFGWAPGGGALDVPVAAGFPVGQGTGNLYAIVQIHYDNPSGLSTVRDNSGVRMYLASGSQLRASDAGFVFLGINNQNIQIPPNKTWHQVGRCNVTQLPQPMNVFAYGLHMHQYGMKMYSEIYRGAVKTGDLGQNLRYSFNAQHFVPINATIRAGDVLNTHCIWNTDGANATIPGGEDTFKEMCLNALLYYPAIPGVGRCITSFVPGCDDCGNGCACAP